MNRTISRLLASVLFVSSAFAASSTETNVTYLNMKDFRSRGEMATMFRTLTDMPKGDDRFGGNIQFMPFYRKSYNKKNLGKGLGVNHNNVVTTIAAEGAAENVSARRLAGTNAAPGNVVTKITLEPEAYAMGAGIEYYHNLDDLYEGVFFKVSTAIAQDNRRDNITFDSEATAGFKALVEKTANRKARYSGSSWESKSGIESPEIAAGYKFFDNDSGNVSFNFAGVIPTGTEPECELINEPLVGGRHFGLGASLSGTGNLWDEEDKGLKVHFDANYRYFFQRDVKVIPQLKVADRNWGHLYDTRATADEAATENKSFADAYTGDAEVKPGSQFDGYGMVSYGMNNFSVNGGYALQFKQGHTPKRKDSYTVRYYHNGTDAAFNAGGHTAIAEAEIDTKREAMILHTFFGSVGAIMKDWDYPAQFGVGGSIDVANKKQITPEHWTVFGKVGISF